MVKYFSTIRKLVKQLFFKVLDKIIRILPIYYTKLDKISIKKWFLLRENMTNLYKINFKYIPNFFYTVYQNMIFQFDRLQIETFREYSDIVVMRSKALRTGNKLLLYQSQIKEAEYKKKLDRDEKEMSLNDFIDYIELTFESIGKIDPEKHSASRVYSLFWRAVDTNNRKKELYEKK